MKIKNIDNPKRFFEILEKECIGTIKLVTSEGDELNLKSKLCQYIVLTDTFNKAHIDEMELLFSEPQDLEKVIQFLVRG